MREQTGTTLSETDQKMVHIVFVNYNSYRYIIACLNSLLGSDYQHFKVYIVDNQSQDNSLSHIANWLSEKGISSEAYKQPDEFESSLDSASEKVFLIQNTENAGFAVANNLAIKPLAERFPNDLIWMLNPDTEVSGQVLDHIVQLSLENPRAIIGNQINYYDQPDKIMYLGGFKVYKFYHGMKDILVEGDLDMLDAIAGTSLAANGHVFKELGYLPESYFMYWEETDFCTRAKRNGYPFVVNTNSVIYDHVGATANTNFLREYLYLLNGLKYHLKYNPFFMPLIVLSTLLKLVKSFIFEGRIKSKALYYAHVDFFKGVFGAKVNLKKRLRDNGINIQD